MADVSGPITSIGMMAGTITITPPGALPVTVVVSDNQRTKMLPRLHIGDVISVKTDDNGHVKGGITIVSQSQATPVSVYPTKKEQVVLDQGAKENAILWQSCMKAAVEIEKFFAVGGAEDRVETAKNVVVTTNNLYEASQRKFRGLPPIPETAPQ